MGLNDSTVFLERISPGIIFLRPPEKLVIEVKSRGRVTFLQWARNGNMFTGVLGQDFTYHGEIYVQEETTQDDMGLYEVNALVDVIYGGQRLQPLELDFVVTLPGN